MLCRPEEFPQVSFLCTRRRGAVLSLPVEAQRQDTRAQGDFGKWIAKHIGSWFTFTRSLGLGIERMEDIVLVTGLHLTRSWANVAFLDGHEDGRASLGVRINNGRNVTWHCPPGSVRGGVRNWGPEGEVCQFAKHSESLNIILYTRQNLLENQCVFIRGFRATRVFGILPRQLRGAAGPGLILQGDHDDDEPDKELISIASGTKVRYFD
jgi:prepilin-type processing-associated H-X9-DG protein